MNPSAPSAPAQRGSIKRAFLFLLVVAAIVVAVGVSMYNGLIGSQEKLKGAWGEIDNQYKRRADLVPNLVETVKGAADFEKGTLEAVVNARAKVSQVQLPSGVPTDPAQLDAYIKAQQQLGGALSRLMVVAEQYPQLKATEAFRDLQVQLEGTENRITVARRDYIEAVKTYNIKVRSFPSNLLAGNFGFDTVPQFEVEAADKAVPKVDFGGKK